MSKLSQHMNGNRREDSAERDFFVKMAQLWLLGNLNDLPLPLSFGDFIFREKNKKVVIEYKDTNPYTLEMYKEEVKNKYNIFYEEFMEYDDTVKKIPLKLVARMNFEKEYDSAQNIDKIIFQNYNNISVNWESIVSKFPSRNKYWVINDLQRFLMTLYSDYILKFQDLVYYSSVNEIKNKKIKFDKHIWKPYKIQIKTIKGYVKDFVEQDKDDFSHKYDESFIEKMIEILNKTRLTELQKNSILNYFKEIRIDILKEINFKSKTSYTYLSFEFMLMRLVWKGSFPSDANKLMRKIIDEIIGEWND